MDQERSWPVRQAHGAGERIAEHRRARGLSAQQLADRCEKLGMPSLSRIVITKLENGHRESVSVAEILVLAKALSVSPAELVFPIGHARTTEVLPGDFRSPWEAVLWFSGMAAEPGCPAEDDTGVVHLYQLHHVILQESWRGEKAAGPSAERAAVAALRSVRAEMRRRGLLPPVLPPFLAWIDDGDAR